MKLLEEMKDMGLTVVAEGVETTAQLDFLVKQNCQHIQDVCFQRPCLPMSF